MLMIPGARIVIIGNSGSGKSTLAEALGATRGQVVFDLDDAHWQVGVGIDRDKAEAKGLVHAFAEQPRWVIEGVYGWLAAIALARANTLIWLDLPWDVCRDSLTGRGPSRGATAEQHADLLAWAAAYWQRQTSTSFAGHLGLFNDFAGQKIRLLNRFDVVAFLAAAHSGTGENLRGSV
jgi:adenylate kinase family enzyme